jgi:hypothetical protein
MSRLAIVGLLLITGCAHHYGYQVAANDVVGWQLVTRGDDHDVRAVEVAGYGVLLAGAPAVHAAHGNWVRAGISLGLRAGVAALLASGGGDASEGTGDEGPAITAMFTGILMVAGVLAVEALDVFVLAAGSGGDPEPEPAAGPARMLSFGGAF